MKVFSKLVALVLAIALLGAPAAALSTCWTTAGEARGGCPAGCPMMAHMPQPANVAQAAGMPCCSLSSGQAATLAQLSRADAPSVTVNPPSAGFSAPVAVAPFPRRVARPMPLSHPPSPQAVLCTFLI